MKERQKKGVIWTWIQALSPDVTEEDLNCFFARSSWSKRINPMHPCKGLSCEHKEKIYSHSVIDGRTLRLWSIAEGTLGHFYIEDLFDDAVMELTPSLSSEILTVVSSEEYDGSGGPPSREEVRDWLKNNEGSRVILVFRE